ncbi:hypothetical protein ILYODFUR_028246 [Ilyodon furcidens]|uniref:Uncharacterized protein n=1 Tax=Ilyodon furcidens TaxID=33524 RepID=A0ABV0U190_9TELE
MLMFPAGSCSSAPSSNVLLQDSGRRGNLKHNVHFKDSQRHKPELRFLRQTVQLEYKKHEPESLRKAVKWSFVWLFCKFSGCKTWKQKKFRAGSCSFSSAAP